MSHKEDAHSPHFQCGQRKVFLVSRKRYDERREDWDLFFRGRWVQMVRRKNDYQTFA